MLQLRTWRNTAETWGSGFISSILSILVSEYHESLTTCSGLVLCQFWGVGFFKVNCEQLSVSHLIVRCTTLQYVWVTNFFFLHIQCVKSFCFLLQQLCLTSSKFVAHLMNQNVVCYFVFLLNLKPVWLFSLISRQQLPKWRYSPCSKVQVSFWCLL